MDNEIKNLLSFESKRQNEGIELIASENYPSKEVREACGSVAICKYAEGYPNHRYYGGCANIDAIESIAINRICKLFNCNFANVQPHCGSTANFAAYHALLPMGGKILSLDLNSGGHLTHGSPVSFSSDLYHFFFYHLDSTGHIDYEDLKNQIELIEPDVVLCGASAYPYIIDFDKIRSIINECNPYIYLMADIAHIAGLVAAGRHPSPFPACDVVTSTTHKTLRGPRGGIIMWNNENLSKRINSAVFPYSQGGPLENIIAAKATMALEAASDNFKTYIDNVLINTHVACETLSNLGAVVSGTENHLFLLNTLASFGLTGKDAQEKLELVKITTNKNMIPGDTLSPAKTSGLRIGLAAMTSRGMNAEQVKILFKKIYYYLKGEISTEEISQTVKDITSKLKDIDNLVY